MHNMLWALCLLMYISVYSVETISICPLTNKVHKRYYFVERLKKTIVLLAKINDTASCLHDLIYNNSTRSCSIMGLDFTHEHVMASLKEIADTHSLKPLFMVWDDFARYKSLDDELLVVDFAKEIFVVTKSILADNNESNKNFYAVPNHDIECILEAIDRLYYQLMYPCEGYNIYNENNFDIRNIFSDICHTIDSDQVYIRMYYINRLKDAFRLMKNIHRSDLAYSPLDTSRAVHFFDQNFFFTHPRIQQAIVHIEQEKNIVPALLLWDDVKQFKYISNDQFIRESLILFFIIQKNMMYSLTDNDARALPSIGNVIELYQMIETLPIEGILDALDILVDVLKDVSEREKEKKEELSLSIFKKHWWLKPIVIITSVGIKVISHYNVISKIVTYMKKTISLES